MHAVCHPCFFTWGDKGSQPYPKGYPKMTADFPGEAQTFVESVYAQKTSVMFMQGCAGDIRPNLPGYPYRCADEADIQWAGRDLGGAVTRAAAFSVTREQLKKRESFYQIRVASEVIDLPGKEGPVPSELMAMKVGPFLFLTMRRADGRIRLQAGEGHRRSCDADHRRLLERQHRLHRHRRCAQGRRL
jgi:hypothetical protein